MHSQLLEVRSGVLHSFDGEQHEVEGGVYLTPEAYLRTNAELDQLRQRREAEAAAKVPGLVLGAAVLGLLAGYWLGRRGRDTDS
jgi:hypothetical protein